MIQLQHTHGCHIKVKLWITLHETPSQSYVVSLAIWDHTMLCQSVTQSSTKKHTQLYCFDTAAGAVTVVLRSYKNASTEMSSKMYTTNKTYFVVRLNTPLQMGQ